MIHRIFSFPNPVNEVSARLVAGGVVLLSLAAIAFEQSWLTAGIAYGFVARVLTGPTLSPLGQLARAIAPRLQLAARPVAGPPKRFAQGVGAAFSVSAAVLALELGWTTASYVLLGLLVVAATLESVFGICLGCKAFALLMRVGGDPRRGVRALQQRPTRSEQGHLTRARPLSGQVPATVGIPVDRSGSAPLLPRISCNWVRPSLGFNVAVASLQKAA